MLSLSPKLRRSPVYRRAFAVIALFSYGAFAWASDPADAEAIPHVSKKARASYILYQSAGQHKAYAIAPGGAWAWSADAATDARAEQQALERCQSGSRQPCVLYALNDKVVFDRAQWTTLWGPYTDAGAAARADTGTAVGSRFYDLRWTDGGGAKVSLSSLRGKIVFLHFWGSWCPPCLREFPSIKRLQTQLQERFGDELAMVLLQVREPFSQSRQWMEHNGFHGMPLYDSGAGDGASTTLTLSNGRQVEDRTVARVFPSSYVLDRNGLVIFSHYGPITDWDEYLAFFADAVERTKAADDNIGMSNP